MEIEVVRQISDAHSKRSPERLVHWMKNPLHPGSKGNDEVEPRTEFVGIRHEDGIMRRGDAILPEQYGRAPASWKPSRP